MKRSFYLILFTCSCLSAFADVNNPMFAGNSLTIQQDTYFWTSAAEDSSWHYDTYRDANGQTITVTGPLGASWAMVSGPGTQTTISGNIQNGVYGDNHQTFSGDGSWVISGITYTHREMQVDYSRFGRSVSRKRRL